MADPDGRVSRAHEKSGICLVLFGVVVSNRVTVAGEVLRRALPDVTWYADDLAWS